MANIADFSLQSASFNLSGRRGTDEIERLMPLYVAMLDFPVIYHEARAWAELWETFAPVEAAYLASGARQPAAIPEPVTAGGVLLAFLLAGTRRRGQ